LLGMNLNTGLLTVASLVIGNLIAPSVGSGLRALTRARAQRVKHVPVDGGELYANGVPLTEAQFRTVFAAYQAELDALPPPAERDNWQIAQQIAASQRLAVITGTHPHAFPNLGDPDQAWEWYSDNNPYATAVLPRRHGFRLLPPREIAAG
jgi:hypothetical protein